MLPAIQPVDTSTAAFVGPVHSPTPVLLHALADFHGPADLHDAVKAFFENGGRRCYVASSLDQLADLPVSILASADPALAEPMLAQCAARNDRIAILNSLPHANLSYGAAYPLFIPQIAGVYSAIDPWKSPADVPLKGVRGPIPPPPAPPINAIREFPGRGILIWGARTLDTTNSDFRYITVRRLMIYLEQSITRGVPPQVTPPQAVSLISDFLTTTWRAGALQGNKPTEAFFVHAGLGTTMTQADIDNGRLIVEIGVAPVRPAEFVIVRIQPHYTKP